MSERLIFLHGGRIPRCVTTVEKRFAYHLLQFATAGGLNLWADGEREELNGPCVWVCHPGPRYKMQERPRGRAWNHRYLAFLGPLAVEWEAAGLLTTRPQTLPRDDVAGWAKRFDRLIDESQAAGRWNRLRAINLLEGMLIDLSELRDASLREAPAWLSRVVGRLQETLTPDYAAIATAESLSLSAFQRRFRAATGQSPHAFVVRHRVAEARRMLSETDLPIKQVAEALGYEDVFYFTRQFKQHAGVPPAAFRQSRQRGARG